MKTKVVSKHALFWSLLKQLPNYNERYKDVIKEGVVHEYSGGRTESLSEMYAKYLAAYSDMIEALKGDKRQRQGRYEATRDLTRKRVIAAICSFLDKQGLMFPSAADKVRYAKGIACRAANCPVFNKIPDSRLSAIYNLYCEKNRVDIRHPLVDAKIMQN
ncbi:MAG: hypothetical protein MdMp024_0517 [Bacteroidales bacterium]